MLKALRSGIDALSVSSSSASKELVCRDGHAKAIQEFLTEPVNHTMQVFGMPGTGKTATVHYALAQLGAVAQECAPATRPTAVFLNGYVIQKSSDVFWTLCVHFCKTRLGSDYAGPADQCAALIEKHFRHGWGRKTALCVVVIDEVDKLVEKHPKALFKIVDWLTLPFANCKLITVSNTMEIAVDAKTRSRLDATRQLVFSTYGTEEMKHILTSRLCDIRPKLFSDTAIRLLCHQTAGQYGDVRRLLQSASAALCGVLMKMEEGTFVCNPKEGIVSAREVHGVVRQIFHDRFVEFIKAIRAPLLFITVGVVARETESMYNRNEQDLCMPLEDLFVATRQAHQTYGGNVKALTRACFFELVELLRQVSLVDLSVGEGRVPVHGVEALLESTEDVFVSLLQPVQMVVDSCRLHDTFGGSIGSHILS